MIEFTLTDGEGNPHRYDMTKHRASDGWQMAADLSTRVIEPLAASLGPALARMVVEGEKDAEGITGALAGFDGAALGATLRNVVTSLPPKTLYGLLANVNRDGSPLIHEGRPTAAFDAAYAGNYYELGRAALEVAQRNGFLPGGGMLAAVQKRASAWLAAQPTSDAEKAAPSGDSNGHNATA